MRKGQEESLGKGQSVADDEAGEFVHEGLRDSASSAAARASGVRGMARALRGGTGTTRPPRMRWASSLLFIFTDAVVGVVVRLT